MILIALSQSPTMSPMPNHSKAARFVWIAVTAVIAAAGLWGSREFFSDSGPQEDASRSAPSASAPGQQEPTLVGNGAATTGRAGDVEPEEPLPDKETQLEVYLRSKMPTGWTAARHLALNPESARRIVEDAPGGVDMLIASCLEVDRSDEALGTYACALVRSYFAPAEHLDSSRRASLAQTILGALDRQVERPAYQALAALEWLWLLNFDGAAFSPSRWSRLLLDVSEPLRRSADLRAHVALARLGVAPAQLAQEILSYMGHAPCNELETSAHLLKHPGVLRALRTYAEGADDRVVARIEGCKGLIHVATVLRVARREAWATLYGHIERLAGLPAVTDVEYIACIREVVMYEPNEGMRALPHFLRSRPEMRMDSVAALLDRSVVSVRSPSQVVELVERGSRYWDTDVMRLRLAD